MRLEDATEFLAIDFDAPRGPALDPELRLPMIEDILEICPSMITLSSTVSTRQDGSIESTTNELRLAHSSVKDFLLSCFTAPTPRSLFGNCAMEDWNAFLSQICIIYLQQITRPPSVETLKSFPAAQYAAQNWEAYLQPLPSKCHLGIHELLFLWFHPSNQTYRNWTLLHDPDLPWRSVDLERKTTPHPLYYASGLGIAGLVKKLLEAGVDPNSEGGTFGSPLTAAVRSGHRPIAELLLSYGANVNSPAGYDSGPLRTAVRHQ